MKASSPAIAALALFAIGGLALNSTCAAQTRITTIDNTSSVGQYAKLALSTDGTPVIAYRNASSGAVLVAKCATADCGAALTINTVDDQAIAVGQGISMAIGSDGNPVISHLGADGLLRIAKCSTPDCSGTIFRPPTINTGAAMSVSETALAISSSGVAIVSYFNNSDESLRLVQCLSTNCTTTDVVIIENNANRLGYYSAIAIGSDGLPVIAYQDATDGDLKVARCSQSVCQSGPSSITVVDNAADDLAQNISITIGADTFPVISYYDFTRGALKVAKCNDVGCTTPATITTVANPASRIAGRYSSIAILPSGRPVIGYYTDNGIEGNVSIARCRNLSCTSRVLNTSVDPAPEDTGQHVSLAIATDGFPMLAYYDWTLGHLKFAKCDNSACDANALFADGFEIDP